MQGQTLVLTKEQRNKAKIEVEVEKKKGKLLGAARPNVPSGTGGGTG